MTTVTIGPYAKAVGIGWLTCSLYSTVTADQNNRNCLDQNVLCVVYDMFSRLPSAGIVGVVTDIIAAAGKSTCMAAEAQMQGEAAGIGKSLQIHQLLVLLQLPSCINERLHTRSTSVRSAMQCAFIECMQSPSLIAALHVVAIRCHACAQAQELHE